MMTPLLSSDENGRPTLEWWHEGRKLTVYIEKAVFVKAWGPNVITEMEDGEIETVQDVKDLQAWLVGEKPRP